MASGRKLNLFSGAFEDEETGQEGEADAPDTGIDIFSGAFDDDETDSPAIDSGIKTDTAPATTEVPEVEPESFAPINPWEDGSEGSITPEPEVETDMTKARRRARGQAVSEYI
jgi:hypothetical protein